MAWQCLQYHMLELPSAVAVQHSMILLYFTVRFASTLVVLSNLMPCLRLGNLAEESS